MVSAHSLDSLSSNRARPIKSIGCLSQWFELYTTKNRSELEKEVITILEGSQAKNLMEALLK